MILTYYENIDLGSASVNITIVSQYHIIYTDLKVHNCIMSHDNMTMMTVSHQDKIISHDNMMVSLQDKIISHVNVTVSHQDKIISHGNMTVSHQDKIILRPFHNWRTIRSDQIVVRSKNLDLDRKLLPK